MLIRATGTYAVSEAKQLHADETGVRCGGHSEWIHVASAATHTLLSHSPKRGRQGFEVGGVLTACGGNLITDFGDYTIPLKTVITPAATPIYYESSPHFPKMPKGKTAGPQDSSPRC